MNNQKHYAAAVSAFVIWGFFPLLLRKLVEYSSGEILYFRILFSSLVLLIVIFGFKRKDLQAQRAFFNSLDSKKKWGTVVLTLVGGALLTINWLTFIYIVNNVNIKTASFSYLICPVITAILGYLLLKEKMTVLQWIAVAFCAISCVLMGYNSALELGYSFLTAVTYALYLITQRRNQGFDRMIMLGFQVLFSFLLLNAIFPYLIHKVPTDLNFYLIITVIAIVFTVFPLFLNLFALNKINSATIGILMYINPLINYSIAFIVFKEDINVIQLVGYSIIFVALILFNYPNLKKMQASFGASNA
jgi:chloramphenicol-sensitive protein RarD